MNMVITCVDALVGLQMAALCIGFTAHCKRERATRSEQYKNTLTRHNFDK